MERSPDAAAQAEGTAAPAHRLRPISPVDEAAARREVAWLRERERTLMAERTRLVRALEEAERGRAEVLGLRREVDRLRDAEYWLQVVQDSWSWRLTAPLRAVWRFLRPRR